MKKEEKLVFGEFTGVYELNGVLIKAAQHDNKIALVIIKDDDVFGKCISF